MRLFTKSTNTTDTTSNTLLGHPKGLFVLFITEMWERFSFYGMRAIFVLFLIDRVHGGFGWSESASLQLYGAYLMMAYLLAIPGGFLADRYIGQRAAVLWGIGLQFLGYVLLTLKNESLLIPALGVIALGTGLLKPNISTMVGGLYDKRDPRRDSGFTIFYMGISVGMMLASFVVGTIGEVYGWEYGFGLAGVGSLLSMTTFWWGKRYIPKPTLKARLAYKKQRAANGLTLTKEEKDRLLLVFISLIAACIFYVALEQSGGLMTLYAEKYTDRHIYDWELPASIFTGLTPAFIVLLGPIVALTWMRLAKHSQRINAIFKMGVANIIIGLGFLGMVGAALQKQISLSGQSSLYWLFGVYFIYAIGDLCLSPVIISFITRVAPRRLKSVMTGTYFATLGVASFLAGKLGEQSGALGERTIFEIIAAITILLGIPFIIFNKPLMILAHGSADVDEEEDEDEEDEDEEKKGNTVVEPSGA